MNKIVNWKEWLQSNFLNIGMFLMFVAAASYRGANTGANHLAMPFNLGSWVVASWIVGGGVLLVTYKRKFNYPRLYPFFIIFPIIISLSSLFSDITLPIEWLFRQFYIFGGLFFLFALFQFSVSQNKLDEILFIMILAAGLQACLGTFHTFDVGMVDAWLPLENPGKVPQGVFQQVNILVSFLATGLCISLYFLSRPICLVNSIFVKIVIVLLFSLSVYVIVDSGSRVGILAMILSLPLILLARYKQLKKHKYLMVFLLIVSLIGGYAGGSGLDQTFNKTTRLADESYADARITMYTIGLELIKDKPVSGYGIGGFLQAWTAQSSDFIGRHPEAYLPVMTTHPHNEILLWGIEGGMLSLAGILAVIIGMIVGLYRCGFQRGGAYAAMLLPITLHSQVEHPFYGSALHWFLWLFIIFLILKHQTKVRRLTLSKPALKTIQISGIVLAFSVSWFSISTLRAESDLFNFLYNRAVVNPPYLKLALNNIYTHSVAEEIAMRVSLYSAIEKNDRPQIELFEQWAEESQRKSPKLKIYEDLISASAFLRPEGNACDAIEKGLARYAHNKPLQAAYESRCQKDINE